MKNEHAAPPCAARIKVQRSSGAVPDVVVGPFAGGGASYPSGSCGGLVLAEGQVGVLIDTGGPLAFRGHLVGTRADLAEYLATAYAVARWAPGGDAESGYVVGADHALAMLRK